METEDLLAGLAIAVGLVGILLPILPGTLLIAAAVVVWAVVVGQAAGWVADFSFEPRLDKPNWVIIDHHATEAVPRQARLIHDLNKSAALLCYELCREHGLGAPALERLLADEQPVNRITAAHALHRLGRQTSALPVLTELLRRILGL